MVHWKRASSPVEAGTSGFLSISDSNRRVLAELGQESQASSWVEAWNSACLSRCSRGERPLVVLYLEPRVFSGRRTGESLPFTLTSFKGWISKRSRGIGFLLRGDREIGVLRNVEPPTRPHLECLRESGLILRCDRRSGTPSRKSRRVDPPVEIRRGEVAQRKWCRKSSVFLSRETGI